MNSKVKHLLIGIAIALVFHAILVIIFTSLPKVGGNATILRLLTLLGAYLPEGIVQFATYALFAFGMLEIRAAQQNVSREYGTFDLKLLPETEQYVLSPDDVNELKLKVIEEEKRGATKLTDIIKKACTKYRSNHSVSEVLEVVGAQVRINLNQAESNQSLIRYVAWAIPSVGFIGTIIGIASSLGYAGGLAGGGDITPVTDALNVAFDTTLVALFLSLILMFYFHVMQEREEKLHTDTESYVIENLVNRLHPE